MSPDALTCESRVYKFDRKEVHLIKGLFLTKDHLVNFRHVINVLLNVRKRRRRKGGYCGKNSKHVDSTYVEEAKCLVLEKNNCTKCTKFVYDT